MIGVVATLKLSQKLAMMSETNSKAGNLLALLNRIEVQTNCRGGHSTLAFFVFTRHLQCN